MSNEKQITYSDLVKVFFRSFPLEWTWNFERQQHMGYCFAIQPILTKLYGNDKEKMKEALERHLEFFNTTPAVSTMILGINISMEEKRVNSNDDDVSIMRNIKASLMGPLAGIGDSIVWGTIRIVATSIGTSLALEGNILGPILFLITFNVPHYLLRWWCLFTGYKIGTDVLNKFEKTGLMPKLSYALSICGLMVVGAMTAGLVKLKTGINLGTTDSPILLQGVFDGIMPSLLPLSATAIIYILLSKGVSINWILLGIAIVGIVGNYFGLFVL